VAAVPLVARVAFPRLSARLGRTAAELASQQVPTRLALEREGEDFLPDGTHAGFDVTEMVAIVRRVLEDIGLTTGCARLVAVIGHGSSSLNNPHESAYDCGACGGGPGGANARAFAMMANDPRVRSRLAADGLAIPDDTRFIGGAAWWAIWDQKDAFAMADRLAIMHEGRIVQTGVPIDLYRRPADSWIATFLGSANLIPGKVTQVGAGEFVADTAVGEVRGALATPESAPAPGAKIVVCVRPECLKLDFMAPEENAFAGSIVASLFQGDVSLHDFKTKEGVVLKVSEANPRQRVGSKATIYAWAEPEDVVGLNL
jgi:hypothetical protein